MSSGYHKILQLFKSDNVWETKSEAKSVMESHAQGLHPEVEKSLMDGEPVIVRYYSEVSDHVYNFDYESIEGNVDPYSGVGYENTHVSHIWVDGYDSFDAMPSDIDYDSAYYIRVGDGSDWDYYKLVWDGLSEVEKQSAGIESLFGVAYRDTVMVSDVEQHRIFLGWFDSEGSAKDILDELNYRDNDVENGFVSGVNQQGGKVLSIHGIISVEKAIDIADNGYEYVYLGSEAPSNLPDWWVWNSGNEGNSFPSDVTFLSSKYYHLLQNQTIGGVVYEAGYYENRKRVDINLVIDDSVNNVLSQEYIATSLGDVAPSGFVPVTSGEGQNCFDVMPELNEDTPKIIRVGMNVLNSPYVYYSVSHGLSSNMNIRSLTPQEILSLGDNNVREAYKFVGTADGTEKQIGETIKIYKDSSLEKVYLGSTCDSLGKLYVWVNGNDSVYTLSNTSGIVGTYVLSENNKGGSVVKLYVKGQYLGIVSGSVITVNGVQYTLQDRTIDGVILSDFYHEWKHVDTVTGNTEFVYTVSEAPVHGDVVYEIDGCTVTGVGNLTVESYNPDDNTITLSNNVTYDYNGTYPYDALCFIYYTASGKYDLTAVDVESFLQENEFGDGLTVNGNHKVSLKLSNTGGLEFDVSVVGENRPLKIKLDETSNYMKPVDMAGSGDFNKVNVFEWVNGNDKVYTITNTPQIGDNTYTPVNFNSIYTVNNGYDITDVNGTFETNGSIVVDGVTYTSSRNVLVGYIENALGDYSLGNYLSINQNGLGLDKALLENSISDKVQSILKINGESFIDRGNGILEATVTGNDIFLAESEDTIPVITVISTPPVENMPEGFYGYFGDVYYSTGSGMPELYTLNKNTTLAEANVIFRYLSYNVDMGFYQMS